MTRRLRKFSELMEAPYLMANYDKESHQIDDGDHRGKYTPDQGYKHIGTMKSGHEIIKRGDGDSKTDGWASYMAIDHTHKIHVKVDGKHENGVFRVNNLTGHKKSEVKAHDFYHHLLDHFPMKSDNTHSRGGAKTWENLSKMPGVKMKHVNSKSSFGDKESEKKIPLDKKNWTNNYHVSRSDPKDEKPDDKELSYSRFIATKKKK